MRKNLLLILVASACLALQACATYTEKIQGIMEGCYEKGRMEEAGKGFQDLIADGDNVHLLRLEKGMAEIASGNANASVKEFEAAINQMVALSRKSTLKELASLIIDDTIQEYSAAFYEQVCARIFWSMAYMLMKGRFEDVSAVFRDLDNKMEQIEAFYSHSYNSDGRGNKLKPSEFDFHIPALGKYLEALTAERRGELDNARLYMEQAKKSMPECRYFVQEDSRIRRRESDNLVFVFAMLGTIPRKKAGVSQELTALVEGIKLLHSAIVKEKSENTIPRALMTAPVKIPVYENRRPFWHGGLSVKPVPGNVSVETQKVADFDMYARKWHKEILPGIMIRAAVRRIIKEAIARGISDELTEEEDMRGFIEAFLSCFFGSTETVDTRSWCTLPRECHAACIKLLPDTQAVTITAKGANRGKRWGEITVPIDCANPAPAFVFVFHPGRDCAPIIIVDEAHRVGPTL